MTNKAAATLKLLPDAATRTQTISDLITGVQILTDSEDPIRVYRVSEDMSDSDFRDMADELGIRQPELPLLDAVRSQLRQRAATAAISPFRPENRGRSLSEILRSSGF